MLIAALDRAIVHTPFVPFSILFTHAVQFLDTADLARLERFTATLQPDDSSPESITHPHRLYELLCQAARLHIDSNVASTDLTVAISSEDALHEFDFTDFGVEEGATANETLEAGDPHMYGLSDWYYGNQQIMSLLDDDVVF